jgi:hypothetical protein
MQIPCVYLPGPAPAVSVANKNVIAAYFCTIFNGCNIAYAAAAEPVDSGTSFVPNPAHFFSHFLNGLPSLSQAERNYLETPFTLSELATAIDEVDPNKSPGLNGLSDEFYCATLSLVGPSLLAALNAMLANSLLSPSLYRSVIRLLPKIPAIPLASQLCSITLLSVGYKILTKILVDCLLNVLSIVLHATQLCSVRGRSIFDRAARVWSGAATVFSVAEHLHRRGVLGFLLSPDFFHAYNRVSIHKLDLVLKAMGFRVVLRYWVATLQCQASACFMLYTSSPDMAMEFSIRQGDLAVSVSF